MNSSFTTAVGTRSIRVKWDASVVSATEFTIKYRISGTRKFFAVPDITEDINGDYDVEIDELKSNTLYDVLLYSVDEEGDNHSLFKTTCKTNETKSNFLMESSVATADKTSCLIVYHFKPRHTDSISVPIDPGNQLTPISNNADVKCDYIRVCDMIAEYKPSVYAIAEKTLLLLGATGTGKSTLINSIMNYIADVTYSDDHRFSLINQTDEERERAHHQHESQTTSVTLYRIPNINQKIGYKLNIIDTPGFLDTRNAEGLSGTQRDFDKRIEIQIKHLLETRVDHLDGIIVVVPMAVTRLTNEQKMVFSSIVNLFGNDVKQNIFIAMTKDDGGMPYCLPLLEASGIPYKTYFRFNNSNLFTKDAPQLDPIIWKKRNESFSEFFKELGKAPKTTVKTSVEVMNARITLKLQLEALKNKLSELAQDVVNSKLNDKLVKKVSKINFVLTVPQYTRTYTGTYSMNCTSCHKTCHENCWVPLNVFNWTCKAMAGKKCLVCDDTCEAQKHKREKYIYKLDFVDKTITSLADLNEFVKEPIKSLEQFRSIIEKIGALIEELKQKALRQDVVSTEAYMQEIIDRERENNQNNCQLRINIIEKVIHHLEKKEPIWSI